MARRCRRGPTCVVRPGRVNAGGNEEPLGIDVVDCRKVEPLELVRGERGVRTGVGSEPRKMSVGFNSATREDQVDQGV